MLPANRTRSMTLACRTVWLSGLLCALLATATVSSAQQANSQVLMFTGSIPGQLDGPVPVWLRLYDANSVGTLRFEETQTVMVTSETFTVRIGDATAGGVPAPVFRDNSSLWIAFALDSAPTVEIGLRTAITSGGYAHAAATLTDLTVRTLNGLAGNVGLVAGPNVTITPSGSALTIGASTGLTVSGDATLTGNGTSGSPLGVAPNGITNAQIANGALSPLKMTGGGAIVGPNVFTGNQIINSGNLGLGIATPNFPLSFRAVAGDKVSLYGDAGNHYGFGVQPYLLQIHTDTPLSDIAFGSGTSATFTETLRLKGNGRVGLGTGSPQASLHVASGDVYLGNVTNAVGGGKSLFWENQGGDVQNSFRINAGAAGYAYDNLFLAGYSNTGATRGTGIKFFTAQAGGGQAERMTIDPLGNIGIGAPAQPFAQLYVEARGIVGNAILAYSTNRTAVGGQDFGNGTGAYGESYSGKGVWGASSNGSAVYGQSRDGLAGNFNGKVAIATLGTGGSGSPLCRNTNNEIADCSSSLRYKTDVRPFTVGLDLVNRLRPIAFTWKQGGMQDIGLGAEEVEQVEPLLTFRNDKGQIEGVKYNQLSAVFVNAITEQQAQIKQQQEQITQQQHELAALKALVCSAHPEADACR